MKIKTTIHGILIKSVLSTAVAAMIALNAAAASAGELKPLSLPQAQDFYQRVITLPGAALRANPGANEKSGDKLPVFSIYYVFERKNVDGKDWVQVGRQLNGPTDGWLAAEETDDWSTMLVMQYAPAGQRDRVLFFEQEAALADIVQAVDPKPIVDRLVQEADSGKPTDPPLVSVEPKADKGVPAFENKPYLMPISNYKQSQFDDGIAVKLLQIASLNADPPAPSKPPEAAPKPMKTGIVFVVDTTVSMQPFIEQTLNIIEKVYADLKQDNLLEHTSFGLIGFRNNMDQEPQRSCLEYVTKVYQPLEIGTPVDGLLGKMKEMHEAKCSTHSFDEDAVAGLYSAINEIDWEPFDARFVIFISDAGALGAKDPKARHPGVDMLNIRENADRKKLAIIPIHLLSEAAAKLNDIEKARRQYAELGRTGDINASKYLAIKSASVEDFQKGMQSLRDALIPAIQTLAANKPLDKPALGDTPAGNDLGKLVVNEMFSAQMRYIGKAQGTQAPLFFKGWSADKDLTKRNLRALDVSVFLTRNQLNELAQALQRIVDQAKPANVDQGSFFSLLRSLAASTIQDPNRYRAKFATIAESNLLPSYLQLLPYKSDFLQMSEENLRMLGKDQFESLVDRLDYLLRAYKDMEGDTRHWRDLGAGDPGQEVYPVPLIYLP